MTNMLKYFGPNQPHICQYSQDLVVSSSIVMFLLITPSRDRVVSQNSLTKAKIFKKKALSVGEAYTAIGSLTALGTWASTCKKAFLYQHILKGKYEIMFFFFSDRNMKRTRGGMSEIEYLIQWGGLGNSWTISALARNEQNSCVCRVGFHWHIWYGKDNHWTSLVG